MDELKARMEMYSWKIVNAREQVVIRNPNPKDLGRILQAVRWSTSPCTQWFAKIAKENREQVHARSAF